MGTADQVSKAVFAAETAKATDEACSWQVAHELRLGAEVVPDGVIHVTDPTKLAGLPPPWSALRGEAAVVEIKMEGDHLDGRAWVRAGLRRSAWDVHVIEELLRAEQHRATMEGRRPQAVTLPPHADLLFVTPHLPDWIGGHSELMLCGQGTWRVGGEGQRSLWIAANALPLHDALVPFLQVRTGKARVAFIRWMVLKGTLPNWFDRYMEIVKMSTADQQSIEADLMENEGQDEDVTWLTPEQVRNVFIRQVPELREALLELRFRRGREEGREESFSHLCQRRLGRPLTEAEQRMLRQRIGALGVDRVGDVILDSDGEGLASWLGDAGAV